MKKKFKVFDIRWDSSCYDNEDNLFQETIVYVNEKDVDNINNKEEIKDYIWQYLTNNTELEIWDFEFEEVF